MFRVRFVHLTEWFVWFGKVGLFAFGTKQSSHLVLTLLARSRGNFDFVLFTSTGVFFLLQQKRSRGCRKTSKKLGAIWWKIKRSYLVRMNYKPFWLTSQATNYLRQVVPRLMNYQVLANPFLFMSTLGQFMIFAKPSATQSDNKSKFV